MNDHQNSAGEILIYQTVDGETRISVRMQEDTVWLSQREMAELFQTTPQNITQHIAAIYEEGELEEKATCKDFLQVRSEGSRAVQRSLKHYNLDVIISVGYRVKSLRGTQFRIWATQRLREYLVKGFTLDDERLAEGRKPDHYFDELLERVRAIRASEYNLYRKIREIYALSIDYDSKAEITQDFYATVQNKMHWAVHGHTAAEVIQKRADAGKPNMGLTNWKGKALRTTDVTTAKNYLNENELKQLHLLVDQYLSFAELQAMSKKPMYMKDWKSKLDSFLTLNDRQILKNLGRISKTTAERHALSELEKFRKLHGTIQNIRDVEVLEKEVKQLSAATPEKKKRKPKKS